MKNYQTNNDYDLLAKVFLLPTEYGGRKSPVFDGYRRQFFWHINDVSCSDWDAEYYFKDNSVAPGHETLCKIWISANLKKYSKGDFPIDRQFCIREGSKVVAAGVILENNIRNA